MDPADLMARLGGGEGFPHDAIRAAQAERAAAVPIFLAAIERCLAAPGEHTLQQALFFAFHLLGEWRETSAYRPLARLLRLPRADVDAILGDAVTATSHRVMAAVFDGDPAPLYGIILDPAADQFVRARMFDALAIATVRGALPRAEMARFLTACFTQLEPGGEDEECFVWDGWQGAIAALGFAELRPLVKEAFARGSISRTWISLEHFDEDLREGSAHPGVLMSRAEDELTLFGDTIEELSGWAGFKPDDDADDAPRGKFDPWEAYGYGPITNPHRDVGRNDPCPCGSGRKYKKCCLNASIGEGAAA